MSSPSRDKPLTPRFAAGETETGYLFADDLNTPRRFEILAQILPEREHGEDRVGHVVGHYYCRRLCEFVWQ